MMKVRRLLTALLFIFEHKHIEMEITGALVICTCPRTLPWLLRSIGQNRVLQLCEGYHSKLNVLTQMEILCLFLFLFYDFCQVLIDLQNDGCVERERQGEGGDDGDSVMKSNNSLRLMGECGCTRSKRSSISFSGVQAHIPGILLLALRCETLKLMGDMRAGSGPGFSVMSCS